MSLSAKIREQLISSFRADLADHVQTMTDGLLALEQNRVTGEERQATLADIFRAAHSLKGAARAVGVTAVEQLSHSLEGVLSGLQKDTIQGTPELFGACYQAIDALQAVQAAYEAGATTPPVQALQALVGLEPFLSPQPAAVKKPDAPSPRPEPLKVAQAVGEEEPSAEEAEEVAVPVVEEREAGQEPERETASVRGVAPSPPAGAVEEPTPPASSAKAIDETIRVSVSKLDALMAQLSELLVTKIRAEQRMGQVRVLQDCVGQWQKEWLASRSAYGRLAHRSHEVTMALGMPEPSRWPKVQPSGSGNGAFGSKDGGRLAKDVSQLLSYVDANQDRLHDMQTLVNDLARQYVRDTTQMGLVIDELEQEIKRVRMLPLFTITGPFARMVRDLAKEAGKEVVLQIVGGETELDKRVLEQIKDPLIHLLRNAVDHGIELPGRRQERGKPRVGTITLSAEQMGNNIIVSVSDDGAGLDLDSIRHALARRGVPDVQSMDETDLVEAMYQSGISTSPIITDISGRGVGLDVVRRNVEALHGQIDQEWKAGEGTTFRLSLPLTLTSSRGLLVRVSNQLFAIQFNAIVRIDDIALDEITPLEGHDTVLFNGRPLTLVRLSDVLGLPPSGTPHSGRIPYIILAAAERRMAFAVDELVDEQEVVIKGLGRQLSRVGGILGATVMGSGDVILILNVADLIKLAMRAKRRSLFDVVAETTQAAETRARRRILVVDDSITTRTLEKNILEAEGYTVLLATDGEEALSAMAANGIPDLIVSDIIMPRMDGFELTKIIKEDDKTAQVPIILVTSLDSPQDKARGIEAGADAYIVKSSFDQNNLLETIEQLI
jgi:two-component system chemotaxis sensor kinase CheA